MSKAKDILSRFSPTELGADLSPLSAEARSALADLKEALEGLHAIYLRQLHEGLPARYAAALASDDPVRRDYYGFFLGPWNPLEGDADLLGDGLERRPGAALWPADLSSEELDRALGGMAPAEAERLQDHYTAVERGPDGALVAVDYHTRYAAELSGVAAALRRAADRLGHDPSCASFAAYLRERADTLVAGDYRSADATWVRMRESPLELVLGPYEVYIDALAGVKAAYEGMLFAVDAEAGKSLRSIEEGLPELAGAFPLPAGSRPAVGGLAPIVVVDLLYAAGEARQGVMAAAFNLPNDPWVRGNVGWKQVMIRNVMRAKFEKVGDPIARAILGGSAASFRAFFSFVLLHEVSHGLGPAFRADGCDVSKALGAHYTAIEEAKADTGALHLLLAKAGRAGVPAYGERELLDSFIAGLFRSMRFGLHEAHGAANLIEFNWYVSRGVLAWRPDGSLESRPGGLRAATAGLLEELCRIEAEATPAEADAFIKRWKDVSPELEAAISGLDAIPTDIRPAFSI